MSKKQVHTIVKHVQKCNPHAKQMTKTSKHDKNVVQTNAKKNIHKM